MYTNMKVEDVLFMIGDFWVKKAKSFKGYEVYEIKGITSVRCSIIGWSGKVGLDKAIEEATRRENKKNS